MPTASRSEAILGICLLRAPCSNTPGPRTASASAALLTPVRDASQRLPWVQELIDSGDIYQPLAWTPAEAHRFLRDIPALEESGLIVRIPDWWQPERPRRPQVSVRVGTTAAAWLGAGALLDFSVAMTLDGEPLTDAERQEMLSAAGGLVRLRGQWVEADGEQLAAALAHWKRIERDARAGGLSFYEGHASSRRRRGSGRTVEELPESLRAVERHRGGGGTAGLLARLRNPERERELYRGGPARQSAAVPGRAAPSGWRCSPASGSAPASPTTWVSARRCR